MITDQGPFRTPTLTSPEKPRMQLKWKCLIAVAITLVLVCCGVARYNTTHTLSLPEQRANAERAARIAVQRMYGHAPTVLYCHPAIVDDCRDNYSPRGHLCEVSWPWARRAQTLCCDSDRANSNGGCYIAR